MAKLSLWLICLTILSYTYTTLAQNFIEISCGKTRYPTECIRTLMPEAAVIGQSSLKLGQIALLKNLKNSEELDKFLNEEARKPGLGPKEHAALKDCLDEMDDILDQLTQSVKEMDAMGEVGQFMLKKKNVQTWVNAVHTDYSTCVDGFSDNSADQNFSNPIKAKVVDLEHEISNALALINQIQGQ